MGDWFTAVLALISCFAVGVAQVPICLFTERDGPGLATVLSIAKGSDDVRFELVLPQKSCCPLLVQLANKHPARVRLHLLGDLTEELVEDGFRPPWTVRDAPNGSASYIVRPPAWDQDSKHSNPLNHLRLYIPHLRFFRRYRNVIFLDDDVIVQSSVLGADCVQAWHGGGQGHAGLLLCVRHRPGL